MRYIFFWLLFWFIFMLVIIRIIETDCLLPKIRVVLLLLTLLCHTLLFSLMKKWSSNLKIEKKSPKNKKKFGSDANGNSVIRNRIEIHAAWGIQLKIVLPFKMLIHLFVEECLHHLALLIFFPFLLGIDWFPFWPPLLLIVDSFPPHPFIFVFRWRN